MIKRDRLMLLVALALLGGSVGAQETLPPDTSYNNGYYVKRLAFFKQLPDRKKEIVFLGNSITEAGDWQDIYNNGRVANRGISGDNVFGVYARLDEVLASRPSRIFLMIGVNDLKRGVPQQYIADCYERIIRRVKAASPKTRLYLQSVLPVLESSLPDYFSKVTNEKISRLNAALQQLAARYQLTYVDLNSAVFSDKNGQMKAELTTDGIHLQAAAYILWINYLRQKKYL